MACSGIKRPKTYLTLKDKIEVLKMFDSARGMFNLNELAKSLKISRSTLLTIINGRANIEQTPEADRHRFRIRNRRCNPYAGQTKYKILEEKLAEWVKQLQQKGMPLSGVTLKAQAKKMAQQLGFLNFTASNGWSDRFKKKYGFEYKNFCPYKPKKYKNINKVKDIKQGLESDACDFLDVLYAEYSVGEKRKTLRDSKSLPKHQKSDFKIVEEKLIMWINKINMCNLKLNGNMIKDMAIGIAGILGVTNFTASNRWLYQFQKRYRFLQHAHCVHCKIKATGNVNDSKVSEEDGISEEAPLAFSGPDNVDHSKKVIVDCLIEANDTPSSQDTDCGVHNIEEGPT